MERRSNPAEPVVALLGPWGVRELAKSPVPILLPDSPLPHIFVDPEGWGPTGLFLLGIVYLCLKWPAIDILSRPALICPMFSLPAFRT